MMITTLIAHKQVRDRAAELCAAIAGPSGSGMFVIPAYTGPNITHYASSGKIQPQFADALPRGERPADYDTLITMAAAAGIETDQVELEAIFDQCDVSGEDWQTAFDRLGITKEPTDESTSTD